MKKGIQNYMCTQEVIMNPYAAGGMIRLFPSAAHVLGPMSSAGLAARWLSWRRLPRPPVLHQPPWSGW
eukprot:CAMPEP_0194706322 /NCGR_PEP_ID=MMETSP0295-20121207/29494_1 /TAXON_ID=39354 /ORGANISM="Heterosigma akashiwo, Strain CCMP2393" /LENGTH=67 /DNA_ID=CAMNT_0039602245 /DNA_START=302 /DNA_END=505 /DNA_ORIENTATION=+